MQRSLNRKPLPPRRMSEWQALCDCTHCTLRYEGQVFLPVPGSGNKAAQIIFVGEAPGEVEVAINEPFVGPSGRLLDDTLKTVGLRREDAYCTNAVLCRPPDNRNPTATEIGACNQRLKQEILALPQRHVIVVLGTPAVKAVTGRNDGIMASIFKTEWNAEFNCFIVFAYHPAACLRNADYYKDVLHTFRHAKDLLDTPKGPITAPPVTYDLEDSVPRCLIRLQILMGAKDYIACDIETTGYDGLPGPTALDWRVGTLEQLGFAWNHYGKDRAYLIPRAILADSRVRASLKKLLGRRDVQWAWHNGKFDVQFIKKYGVAEAHVDIDTMLMHKSLDERSGVHGLKQIGARFFGDYDWGEEKVGFTDPMYHAKDCIYTLRLGRDTLPTEFVLEPPSPNGYPNPRFRHDTVLAPVWNIIADDEMHGVSIDMEYAEDLEKKMAITLELTENECLQITKEHRFAKKTNRKAKTVEDIPQGVYRSGPKKGQEKPSKHKTTYGGEIIELVSINLNSPKMLGQLLYDIWKLPVLKLTKSGQPAVDRESIEQLKMITMDDEQRAFFRLFSKFRLESKLYSTYVLGAIREGTVLDAKNPSIHTHFNFNPVTGRPSSADLNIQNIPRESPIKKIYIARPGYWFVQADYGQQEMRVAAWYSKDSELLKACMQSDFHEGVARQVFREQYAQIDACGDNLAALENLFTHYASYRHIAAEHARQPLDVPALASKLKKHLRTATKGINFGALYGQTPSGLQEYLLHRNGIEISLEEAAEYHRAWFKNYHHLSLWLSRMREQIETVGFVDTPVGHRRRKYLITDQTLSEAHNQAMNSPIQSLASDMTMLAIIALDKILRERSLGHILFFVHDSIAFEIKKERLEEGAAVIKQTMEHALDFIQKPDFYVPFPVDIEYGRGWGELQPLKIVD